MCNTRAHIVYLKAAFDRWLFNGAWSFIDNILTSTWPSFSLFSSNVVPVICVTDVPTFPWYSALMVFMYKFISRMGTVTCVATSAMLDCQRKNHASELPEMTLDGLSENKFVRYKHRDLKWCTKLSAHCSQVLFSGLKYPLQPSCFQITLRSLSSHESAAALSSLFIMTARPLVTLWSNTGKFCSVN